MQEFLVHIIVGICVLWAVIMIYKRFKGTQKPKCADCPLCNSCTQQSGCTGYTHTGKSQQTKIRELPGSKNYSAN